MQKSLLFDRLKCSATETRMKIYIDYRSNILYNDTNKETLSGGLMTADYVENLSKNMR